MSSPWIAPPDRKRLFGLIAFGSVGAVALLFLVVLFVVGRRAGPREQSRQPGNLIGAEESPARPGEYVATGRVVRIAPAGATEDALIREMAGEKAERPTREEWMLELRRVNRDDVAPERTYCIFDRADEIGELMKDQVVTVRGRLDGPKRSELTIVRDCRLIRRTK